MHDHRWVTFLGSVFSLAKWISKLSFTDLLGAFDKTKDVKNGS